MLDLSNSTPIEYFSFNEFKYPPGLFNPANCSGRPIALITNGAPTFSLFISIIFPPHIIPVVGTNLWSLIDIASAPAFFNSFITLNISPSCTTKEFGSNTEFISNLLSLNVIITPGPVTSSNPIILFPFFISSSFDDNSSLFSVEIFLCSSNSFSASSYSLYLLSYLSLYFRTSALNSFSS